MRLPISPDRSDLVELLEKAVEAFNALSPNEKREHRRAQKRSWVIGEMMMNRPDSERHWIEAMVDRILKEE